MLRFATLLFVLALPSLASAQGDTERARAHHEAGVSYFDQGRYEEAAEQFQEAYALSGRHHLLLNVSRALELSGDPGGAADALERYLAAEPNADSRVTLERRMQELRARAQADAPPPEEPSGDSSPDVTAPVILLAGAGAVLATALVTGLVALDLHGSVSGRCPDRSACPPEVQSDIDTGSALALTSDILYGVGGALAIAGGVWLIVALATGGDDDASAACTAGGCGPALRF